MPIRQMWPKRPEKQKMGKYRRRWHPAVHQGTIASRLLEI